MLKGITREELEKFLHGFEQLSYPLDKMKHFLELSAFEWVKNEMESSSLALDMNENSHIILILKNKINDYNKPLDLRGMEILSQNLIWPSKGNNIERINEFMFKVKKLERRLPSNDNPAIRKQLNRAIFKVLPDGFGLTESFAELPAFNTLAKIESYLFKREWNVKATKVKKVSRIAEDEMNDNLLTEALAVLDQGKRDDLAQMEFKVQKIERTLNNLNNPTPQTMDWNGLIGLMNLMKGNNQPIANYVPQRQVQAQQPRQINQQNNNNQKPKRIVDQNGKQRYGLDPSDFNLKKDAKVFSLKRTGNALDCIVKALNPVTRTYETVKGCLDSGAYTTCGNFDLHQHLCKSIRQMKGEVFLQLPNGQLIPAYRAALMDLRAETSADTFENFPNTLVFLVKDKNWTELLIGRPTLIRSNLLPEQNFTKKN